MTGISRRQLFRGDLRGRRVPLRPPWAAPEKIFAAGCERCGDCVRICPERVIRIGDGGFPEMDFSHAGCSLCQDCVRACRGRALTANTTYARAFPYAVEIDTGCLARSGVVCRACGEACDAGAIRFRLRVGQAAEPLVEAAACTGCGACLGRCPVQAMRLVLIHPSPARVGVEERTL